MELRIKKSLAVTVGLVALFAAACAKQQAYNPNWMDDSPFQRQDFPLDSGAKSSLSNQSLNSLGGTDGATLNNLINESDDVLPENVDEALSAAMKKQAEYIAQMERQGKDMAQEKFELHAAASTYCMQKAEQIGAPILGNSFVGTWSGLLCEIPGKGKKGAASEYTHYRGTKKKDKKKKQAPAGEMVFEVSFGGAPGQLVASGGVQGPFQVRQDSVGILSGTTPWIGQINERSGNMVGELANGKYNKVGEYDQSCKIKVALRSSADPDAQRMVDGTRMLAACYGNIMSVLSPTSDRMFQSMDKDLAYYLKLKLLGLN